MSRLSGIRSYKYTGLNYLSIKTFHYPSPFQFLRELPTELRLLKYEWVSSHKHAVRAASIRNYRSCPSMILETFVDANFCRAVVGIWLLGDLRNRRYVSSRHLALKPSVCLNQLFLYFQLNFLYVSRRMCTADMSNTRANVKTYTRFNIIIVLEPALFSQLDRQGVFCHC